MRAHTPQGSGPATAAARTCWPQVSLSAGGRVAYRCSDCSCAARDVTLALLCALNPSNCVCRAHEHAGTQTSPHRQVVTPTRQVGDIARTKRARSARASCDLTPRSRLVSHKAFRAQKAAKPVGGQAGGQSKERGAWTLARRASSLALASCVSRLRIWRCCWWSCCCCCCVVLSRFHRMHTNANAPQCQQKQHQRQSRSACAAAISRERETSSRERERETSKQGS
jgi:hypothetical protein